METTKYIGSMTISGEFINKHYNKLYTKKELKHVDNEEGYRLEYYSMIPEKTHSHPCYAINFFKIPDISNDIKEVTFNTLSLIHI